MGTQVQSNLDISVDCVVFGFHNNKLKVLLIERERSPESNEKRFALPGDLILDREDIDQAAERILFELTKLNNIYLRQYHTFGRPDRVSTAEDRDWLRHIRKNPDARVVTVAYYALVKMEDYTPSPSSFAERAGWADVLDIPQLAFDHNEILDKALEILRNEVSNNRVGFELLPEKFTLGQLQQLYEVILNKQLDKRNFRKSIKKMDSVMALDEKQKGVLHKPAQLFTYVGNKND